MTARPFVVGLEEPAARLPDFAGGKGASLARMVAGGLPVPSGFVVSADAFQAVASSLSEHLFDRMADSRAVRPCRTGGGVLRSKAVRC